MTRKSKKVEIRPRGWQLDPASLCGQSSMVQYWSNGVMATGQMPKEKAIQLVKDGNAFVISESAVGAMVNGVSYA